MPRFAANLTMMFQEVPFLDRFRAAAEAGFAAVECLFPYVFAAGDVAERLARCGLTLALINAPPGDWDAGERGLAALGDRQDEFRQSLAAALAYAAETGVRRLHVMSGIADRHDPRAAATWRDAIAYAADRAGEAGVDILIEPLNGRDAPGYFLDDFDDAAERIAALGRSNVRLQFDIYHRQILHGDVLRGLEALMPIIGHVQIASVPLRHEPGTGELDDIRILRALDMLGYEGFVGCEYRPAASTSAGLGWMEPFHMRAAHAGTHGTVPDYPQKGD